MRLDRMVIPRTFFVNIAAVGLALFLGGWVVSDYFTREEVPTCSMRYAHGTQFALESKGGELLSPEELQARLNGSDQGVLENVELVRLAQGPSVAAIKVRLAATRADSESDPARFYGIGFHWVPRRLPTTHAACLTYAVRVPKDFDYVGGGNLPGLTGGRGGDEHVPGAQAISTRPRWLSDGRLELRLTGEGGQTLPAMGIDFDRVKLVKGAWMRIEQEVILNTPGKKDGLVRVWIDDKIRLEKLGVALRNDANARFHGVSASIGFSQSTRDSAKSGVKESQIEVSPFEVRWP